MFPIEKGKKNGAGLVLIIQQKIEGRPQKRGKLLIEKTSRKRKKARKKEKVRGSTTNTEQFPRIIGRYPNAQDEGKAPSQRLHRGCLGSRRLWEEKVTKQRSRTKKHMRNRSRLWGRVTFTEKKIRVRRKGRVRKRNDPGSSSGRKDRHRAGTL